MEPLKRRRTHLSPTGRLAIRDGAGEARRLQNAAELAATADIAGLHHEDAWAERRGEDMSLWLSFVRKWRHRIWTVSGHAGALPVPPSDDLI